MKVVGRRGNRALYLNRTYHKALLGREVRKVIGILMKNYARYHHNQLSGHSRQPRNRLHGIRIGEVREIVIVLTKGVIRIDMHRNEVGSIRGAIELELHMAIIRTEIDNDIFPVVNFQRRDEIFMIVEGILSMQEKGII